jgi:SAM-dependent methyltransferase
MTAYQPETYGQRIAGVYDDWYDIIDPATVPVLAELARARPGSRALELGIGTGRVAIPLQQAGVAVEGIDASEAMVARMRDKPGGDQIPVLIGDMAEFAVEGEYALVYVLFTTFFCLLTQEDQVRCFRNVAQHLSPQGSFVLEAFVPDPARLSARQTVRASDVGADALRLEAAQIDLATQVITGQTVLLTEEGVRLFPVKIRYAWPSELDLMARLAGLELRHRWANWRKDEFTAQSTGHVSVYGWPQTEKAP